MVEQYRVEGSGKSTKEADKAIRAKTKELTNKLGEGIAPSRSVFRAQFQLNGKPKGTQETQFSLESDKGWDALLQIASKGHDLSKYNGNFVAESFYDLSSAQTTALSPKRSPAGYEGHRYSSLDVLGL